MRRLANGTRLAAMLTGATALVTAAQTTAYAHDDFRYDLSPLQATTLDLRVPLNTDVYHAFLDLKLDAVEAKTAALRAKVAAIPADTVLTGFERRAAKSRLAKVAYLGVVLDALPDSGRYAPTATERAQVARIQAMLGAIAATLKALLANVPAVTPTSTALPGTTMRVPDFSVFRHGGCDGHWGDRDGSRWWRR